MPFSLTSFGNTQSCHIAALHIAVGSGQCAGDASLIFSCLHTFEEAAGVALERSVYFPGFNFHGISLYNERAWNADHGHQDWFRIIPTRQYTVNESERNNQVERFVENSFLSLSPSRIYMTGHCGTTLGEGTRVGLLYSGTSANVQESASGRDNAASQKVRVYSSMHSLSPALQYRSTE